MAYRRGRQGVQEQTGFPYEFWDGYHLIQTCHQEYDLPAGRVGTSPRRYPLGV